MLSTVVHLFNRLPTSVLQHVSPYEALCHVTPNSSLLEISGCLCYLYLRSYNSHIIQFRSSPYTFLGYSPRDKGYKCLDSTGRIIISRHVVFHETKFPFHSKSESPTSSVTPTSNLLGSFPLCSPISSSSHSSKSASVDTIILFYWLHTSISF